VGAAHKIFLDDDGPALVKPKQAFRLTQNNFKKLLQKFSLLHCTQMTNGLILPVIKEKQNK